jgi:hypothetical protein
VYTALTVDLSSGGNQLNIKVVEIQWLGSTYRATIEEVAGNISP